MLPNDCQIMSRPRWRPRSASQARKSNGIYPEARIKHLEFIQSIISRLATDSFLSKGWALTVAGALDGFAVNHLNPWISLVGLLPVSVFWILDTYFLRAERLFRCLYEAARKPDSSVELFSMDYTPFRNDKRVLWRKVVFSQTLSLFYGLLFAAGLAIFAAILVHNDKPAHAVHTASATSSSTCSGHGSFDGQMSPISSPYQRGTRCTCRWRTV